MPTTEEAAGASSRAMEVEGEEAPPKEEGSAGQVHTTLASKISNTQGSSEEGSPEGPEPIKSSSSSKPDDDRPANIADENGTTEQDINILDSNKSRNKPAVERTDDVMTEGKEVTCQSSAITSDKAEAAEEESNDDASKMLGSGTLDAKTGTEESVENDGGENSHPKEAHASSGSNLASEDKAAKATETKACEIESPSSPKPRESGEVGAKRKGAGASPTSAEKKRKVGTGGGRKTPDGKRKKKNEASPAVKKKPTPKKANPKKKNDKGGEEEDLSDMSAEESESSDYREEEMHVPDWYIKGVVCKPKGLMRPDDDNVIECKEMKVEETAEEKRGRKALNKLVGEYFLNSQSNRERFLCAHLDLFRPFLIEKARTKWYTKLLDFTKELTPEEALKQAETDAAKEQGNASQPLSSSSSSTKSYPDLEPRARWLRARVKEEKDKHDPLKQPPSIKNGTLRDYQLIGVNWINENENYGSSVILGDEMGLGKTLQTISFLAHLKTVRKLEGPSVVVAPLSVLSSWMNEFDKWCPELKAVRFHGPWVERQRIAREYCKAGTFDVIVTTYEMVVAAQDFFANQYFWRYLVIDEAHRLKNEAALVSQALLNVPRSACLLLTGTPLQNNMHELWSLLYFLQPDLFTCSAPFDKSFDIDKGSVNNTKLGQAHKILRPLMLRRKKKDVMTALPPKTETNVYVPLAQYQVFWYKRLLARDSGVLSKVTEKFHDDDDDLEVAADGSSKSKARKAPEISRLMSLFTQLRKVCNHPYLFPNAELNDDDRLPESEDGKRGEHHAMSVMQDHHLIKTSGKLRVLDKLLVKLKQEDHRVLIFSLFTSMLDILEDYCRLRGWEYCRLDGSTNRVRRVVEVKRFNAKNSRVFLFLISTRAGGLGINLPTADTVVHYDSDFNPQVDLQAQDRCHRIGQTKSVHVYRLVTEGTVEERVVMRAQKKLYLDKMVTGLMETKANEKERMSTGEVLSMLMFGADRIFRADDSSGEVDLDQLLKRSAKMTDAAKKQLEGQEEDGNGKKDESEGGDNDKEDDNNNNKQGLQDGKLSAKNFDFSKAVMEIREFQGVKYDRSTNNMATEFDKIRRMLDIKEEHPIIDDDDDDDDDGGKGSSRKSRRLRKKQKEKESRASRRRKARRLRRERGMASSSHAASRHSRKRRRTSEGERDWWEARAKLPPPRKFGPRVTWAYKRESVNCCFPKEDETEEGQHEKEPLPPLIHTRRLQKELLPAIESRAEFKGWLKKQKNWWWRLHGMRNRLARQPADVASRRAKRFGLTERMQAKTNLQVVTWKIDDIKLLEHDYFVTPREVLEAAGGGDYDEISSAGGMSMSSGEEESSMMGADSLDEFLDNNDYDDEEEEEEEEEEERGGGKKKARRKDDGKQAAGEQESRYPRRSSRRRTTAINSNAAAERDKENEDEEEEEEDDENDDEEEEEEEEGSGSIKSKKKKKKPTPASRSSKKRKSTKRWKQNDWCHLCKCGGEDLGSCNWCPRSYHAGCIGRAEIPKGYFSCPQHQCSECGRKANEAGGLLFRCVVCPCAYCEDHVPSEHNSGRIDLPNGCEELEEIGYVQPSSAYYVVCSHSCVKYYDAFKNDFVGYKEENRPDGKETVMIDGEEKLVEKHQCACCAGYEEPEKLHCLCQTPYDEEKFYIGCDECRKWFHGDCVGVQEGQIPEEESWTCPVCIMKRRQQRFTGGRADEDLFEISQYALERADMSDDEDIGTPVSSDLEAVEELQELAATNSTTTAAARKFMERMTKMELKKRLKEQKKREKAKAKAARKAARAAAKAAAGSGAGPNLTDIAKIVRQWDLQQVCSLLMAMNIPQYIPIFRSQNIVGLKFLMLDPTAMAKLGMKPFHAARLYNTVAGTIAGAVKKRGRGRPPKRRPRGTAAAFAFRTQQQLQWVQQQHQQALSSSSSSSPSNINSMVSQMMYQQQMMMMVNANAAAAAAGSISSPLKTGNGSQTIPSEFLAALGNEQKIRQMQQGGGKGLGNNFLYVDPYLGMWPSVTANPTVARTLRVIRGFSEMAAESTKPIMIMYQNGNSVPVYAPQTGSYMFHNVPPGCPLPRLIDVDPPAPPPMPPPSA